MPGKLKPLDVERETRPGKYPDGDGLYLVVASAHVEELELPVLEGRQAALARPGLAQRRVTKECAPSSRCGASPRQRRSQHTWR